MTGLPAWAEGIAGTALDWVKRLELEIHPDYLVVVALGLGDGVCLGPSAQLGAQLRPRRRSTQPADGLFEFDLVWGHAEPGCLSLSSGADNLVPLTASYTWCNYPAELLGVRVYAAGNALERRLAPAELQDWA
ncbi:MAG: hypothetical protein OIF35_12890 [Cellvibrionaceae bacterium]|nr:hypothetical protein [Cellvibrionaceae bacterium]MCV6627580.1 hypothetical protein [Cellvibrionaceae bacterium]